MNPGSSRKHFLIAGGAAASLAVIPSRAPAAQFEFKLAHDLPASHPIGVGVNEMAAAIAKESNGRLVIRVFPDGQLGGSTSLVTQLRTGALEILMQGAAPFAAIVPVMSVGFVGFAFPTNTSALAAVEGDLGVIFRRELDAKGIHIMDRVWEAGMRQMTTSGHAIRSVDDLGGVKIRVPLSPITIDLYKTLGASPVGMNLTELYTALQTKVVDAADGPYINLFAQKIYEVQHYVSVTNHQWSGYWFGVSGESWKMLPPDLQTVLARNANLYALREHRTAALQNASTGDLLVRYGMKKNNADTSTMRSKLAAYYGRWKKEFGNAAWDSLEKYSGKLG